MILSDVGPLIALLDRGDSCHERCARALAVLSAPLLTTWPAFTEAMYLLGARSGWPAQDRLWSLVLRGDLELAVQDGGQLNRCARLMEKYRDVPMDLADATLVTLAETREIKRVFTLDAHFQVYRYRDREPFELLP